MDREKAELRRAAMARLAEEHKPFVGRSLYIGDGWDICDGGERATEDELSRFAEFTFCTVFNASLNLSEKTLAAHRRILKINGKLIAIASCDKNVIINERRIGLCLISKTVLYEDNDIQIVEYVARRC